MTKSKSITSEEIIHLDFPDNVRKRSGMYIGSTETPDQLLREIVDNCIDELFASESCDKINIQKWGNSYFVMDNGRGIPFHIDEESGVTKTELAVGKLHSSSKFDKITTSIGQNGVGAAVVNALSSFFRIFSYNKENGMYYELSYERGVKKSESYDFDFNTYYSGRSKDHKMGFSPTTIVEFVPDKDIFDTAKCNLPVENLSACRMIFDKFYDRKVTINTYKTNKFDMVLPKNQILFDIKFDEFSKNDLVRFLFAFEIGSVLEYKIRSGVVNCLIVNAGKHIDILTDIFVSCLLEQFSLTEIYKKFMLLGITTFTAILVKEVDFDSQTKSRLVSIDGMDSSVKSQIRDKVNKYIRSNRDVFEVHIERLKDYVKSLEKISQKDKIISTLHIEGEGGSRKLPSDRLYEAGSKDRQKCELYICEGKSAGGSLVGSRDPKYIAVLPLRGKPLNSVGSTTDRLLDNQEMSDFISCIGLGINEYYNLEKIRYGKIVLCTDADVDGANIAALLLGTIASHMTFLLDNDMVYIVEAPLYYQDNKYFFSDNEGELNRKKKFTRFKGLGELNANQVKDSLISTKNRRLIRITREGVDDAMAILSSAGRRKSLMLDNKIIKVS